MRVVASPSYCKLRPVWLVYLLRPFGALELPVLDVFQSLGGHLVSLNEVTSVVGAFVDAPTYPLEQSAELVQTSRTAGLGWRRS